MKTATPAAPDFGPAVREGGGAVRRALAGAREERKKVGGACGALDEALDALEKDHAFLLKGDVFNKDIIRTWIEYKRTKEVDAIRIRPHPYEFSLYFDL